MSNIEKAKTFEELDRKINYHVGAVKKSYMYIGQYLTEMKAYKQDIQQFALEQYGFKKSTTYNMMRLYSEFGSLPNNEYSYTQLVDMLSMSVEQREKVSPDMSVREIRKIKTDSNRLEIVETEEVLSGQIDLNENCKVDNEETEEVEKSDLHKFKLYTDEVEYLLQYLNKRKYKLDLLVKKNPKLGIELNLITDLIDNFNVQK